MLIDCLRGLLAEKRLHASASYGISGVSSTLTGMSDFSMNWALPEEEEKFLALSGEAIGLGAKLTTAVNHTFTDLRMASSWSLYKDRFPNVPKFRVRSDIEGETYERPLRIGVYVPQDDPYGTLQFAWTGNPGGALNMCETLSELALEYVSIVGRDKLWIAPTDSFRKPDRGEPTDQYFDDWCRAQKHLSFHDSVSSRNPRAFTKRPCKWYFVERVPDEFEDDLQIAQHTDDNIGA